MILKGIKLSITAHLHRRTNHIQKKMHLKQMSYFECAALCLAWRSKEKFYFRDGKPVLNDHNLALLDIHNVIQSTCRYYLLLCV